MTFPEQQTEWIISNNLVKKGWHIDSNHPQKNAFFQKPKLEAQSKQLKGGRPDYILYQTGTNKPIAIIEAKRTGVDLKHALAQATSYAKKLNVPLVFAMDGVYCETRFVPNDKPLILNGQEVQTLITEQEVLQFLANNTHEAYTIPKQVIVDRNKLIKVFKEVNNTLRTEGIRAGIERFSEFANILFIKLLSEHEKASYWDEIKKFPDRKLIESINHTIIKEIEKKYGGNVFSPISIQNPSTLRQIIDKLDPLTLSAIDADIKGDAFEYFLKQTTSTHNDLGEYFTPRHVIKTVIDLVAPRFGETIYDPFCGTGGFLIAAFHYVKNTITEKEDLQRLKQDLLFGGEITNTAGIAKMSMILHGDGHTGVQKIDSLAHPVQGKYDIVVTNIPFSQKTTAGPLYYNGIAQKNGDATCVLHCLQALKKGGRMALIVPEGFLFRKNLAKVRQLLLTHTKLHTIISLPQGAFLPYTGVKTNILYCTQAHEQNTQKDYWYFQVKNDGYSLDNHRRPLKGKNDLHQVAESDVKKAAQDEAVKASLLQAGFALITLEQVKNNHWNWVGRAYRSLNDSRQYKAACPMVKLGEIIQTLQTGKRPKGGATKVYEENMIISLGGEHIHQDGILDLAALKYIPKLFYDTYAQKDLGIVRKEDILLCKDGALTGKLAIVRNEFEKNQRVMINEHLFIIRTKANKCIQKYLFHALLSDCAQNLIREISKKSAQPGLNRADFLNLPIPLPPLHVQQAIVAELDSYQKIIAGAKQVMDSWKPYFTVDGSWESVKLGDLLKNRVIGGGKGKTITKTTAIDGDIPVIAGGKTSPYTHNQSNFEGNVITISASGTAGFVAYHEYPIWASDCSVIYSSDETRLITKYLYYALKSQQEKIYEKQHGAVQKHVYLSDLHTIQISLPTIEIQRAIVAQLEAERKLVASQKAVMATFEKKIQTKLASLWHSPAAHKPVV